MRVKITKASRKGFWYADKIGEEFEVSEIDFDNRNYGVVYRDKEEIYHLIRKEDCIDITFTNLVKETIKNVHD